MNGRLIWMLKTIFVGVVIMALNLPIAYAICHDITPHYTTLITTIIIISVLYGYIALFGPQHFHAVLIGILAGNLISLLTWIVSFRDVLLHISDPDKLSVFYSVGVFIPATIQFFMVLKKEGGPTKKLQIFSTAVAAISLFAYLLYRFFNRQFHDSIGYNFFHFSLGLFVGVLSAITIRFIVTRNILVFQKLSLYLEVMFKPIIAFFLGYLLIMLTFAGIYTLVYFSDATVFTHLKNDVFGELMFYSFSTITGMTFSAIEPQNPVAFFLTTAEHFLGLVWMTVVFAAALAHLQVPFRKISIQLDKLMGEEKKL